MNHSNAKCAKCYVGLINEIPVSFCSVFHFPHPRKKNIKKVHRLVVLPDYQGIGLGSIMLDYIANKYKNMNFEFGITTSQSQLNYNLKKSSKWRLISSGRIKSTTQKYDGFDKSSSYNRMTCSWYYK